RGLVRTMPESEVTVIGNTGDDAIFHGLHVSPDLDIVTYTLAQIVDDAKGWGVAGDTRHALDHMGRLGLDTWFWLGDRDLARTSPGPPGSPRAFPCPRSPSASARLSGSRPGSFR